MKTIIILFTMVWCSVVFGQVNIGGVQADASAVLDVQSVEKGVLLPRMSTIQRLAIVDPANGLQVYDNDVKCNMIYRNDGWDCYPGEIVMNSRIAAILTFDNIPQIGAASNATATSGGVTVNYNPDGILEVFNANKIRFLKSAKYEITMTGTIHRDAGINVLQGITFMHGLAGVYCTRESPGSIPSDINYFCKDLVNIYAGNDFDLVLRKLEQGTANTTAISLIKPMVIIKYIDLF